MMRFAPLDPPRYGAPLEFADRDPPEPPRAERFVVIRAALLDRAIEALGAFAHAAGDGRAAFLHDPELVPPLLTAGELRAAREVRLALVEEWLANSDDRAPDGVLAAQSNADLARLIYARMPRRRLDTVPVTMPTVGIAGRVEVMCAIPWDELGAEGQAPFLAAIDDILNARLPLKAPPATLSPDGAP